MKSMLLPTIQLPLAQTSGPQAGLAAYPSGGALAGGLLLGLAVAAGGAYGGYLLGGKIGAPKHKTAGHVIGAIAGWIIVPGIIGTLLIAATAPAVVAAAQPQPQPAP